MLSSAPALGGLSALEIIIGSIITMTFSDEVDKLEGRKIRTKWQFRFF